MRKWSSSKRYKSLPLPSPIPAAPPPPKKKTHLQSVLLRSASNFYNYRSSDDSYKTSACDIICVGCDKKAPVNTENKSCLPGAANKSREVTTVEEMRLWGVEFMQVFCGCSGRHDTQNSSSHPRDHVSTRCLSAPFTQAASHSIQSRSQRDVNLCIQLATSTSGAREQTAAVS